jgi:RNA polymerase sigma factor (TIGR02999 family)
MTMPDTASFTTLLKSWKAGDGRAFAKIIEAAHAELERMARGRLRGDNGLVTLAPGELLNEAVVRVMQLPPTLDNSAHFFATMSLLMRSVLVDRARARLAGKRGAGAVNVTWTDSAHGRETMAFDVIALDEALRKLEALDERSSRVLEMACFGGMEREEIAKVMEISVPTVDRDLKFARAWIGKALSPADTR